MIVQLLKILQVLKIDNFVYLSRVIYFGRISVIPYFRNECYKKENSILGRSLRPTLLSTS